MNNLAEYENPIIYDWENADFDPDGPFFLALAQQLGGAALEIACGTGRLTIPLAQAGVTITGLDIAPAMLARAKEKAGKLPIDWMEADARQFDLKKQFNLIFMSSAGMQHLLTRADQEAALACVCAHLSASGRFVFSVLFPHVRNMEASDGEIEWFTYTNDRGQEVRVTGTDAYDDLSQVHTETAYRRWKDENDQENLQVAPLSLRYFFPQELEALLHYNGFETLERYGDWDGSPLTNESQIMIFVCRAAEPKNKAELLAGIQRSWELLNHFIAGRDLTIPDAGGWTIADNLAHITEWERFVLRNQFQGVPPAEAIGLPETSIIPFDVDRVNALLLERNRKRPAAEVLADFHAIHAQLLAAIEASSEEALTKPPRIFDDGVTSVLIWTNNNTRDHYDEHLQTICRANC
jgi:SAM-dependent methyltransferase